MKKLTVTIIAFLMIMSLSACDSSKQGTDEESQGVSGTPNGSVTSAIKDSGSEDKLTHYFKGNPTAASVLPEPWMAYPDSIVDIDWKGRGLTQYPAWTLVAPSGTTRKDVVDYYVLIAEQRNDFETIETYHGITGVWAWKGVNITIEPDVHQSYSDFVQIMFAFQEDYK